METSKDYSNPKNDFKTLYDEVLAKAVVTFINLEPVMDKIYKIIKGIPEDLLVRIPEEAP
jgi:hypothetical protein